MSEEQKIVIIAGTNGAGKTTFAREFLVGEAAWVLMTIQAKARKTAKDTRIPLIIYRDGKIRRYKVYNEDIS